MTQQQNSTMIFCPFQSRQQVRDIWHQIANKSAVSFFNDWPWVSNWLSCIPKTTELKFIVNIEESLPVCCFFIGINKQKENRIKKTRGYINNTGDEVFDDLVIEYNTVLSIKNNIEEQILKAFNALPELEEIRLSHNHNCNFTQPLNFYLRAQSSTSHWVDLNAIGSQDEYTNQLSTNTRKQIKQSMTHYAKQYGDINIEFANSAETALSFLERLKSLHQEYWQKKGNLGAFSTEFFCNFHTHFIKNNFSNGSVHLIKITAGNTEIGYVYNFIHNNEVLFYQSGFNYIKDNKLRPGLICHFLAIKQYKVLGMEKYNFLVGDMRYKKSLSTKVDTLTTWVIARKNLKGKAERLLRKLKNIL